MYSKCVFIFAAAILAFVQAIDPCHVGETTVCTTVPTAVCTTVPAPVCAPIKTGYSLLPAQGWGAPWNACGWGLGHGLGVSPLGAHRASSTVCTSVPLVASAGCLGYGPGYYGTGYYGYGNGYGCGYGSGLGHSGVGCGHWW